MKQLIFFIIGFLCSTEAAWAFSDVKDGHPHAEAIEYVKNHDIVQGYGDGTYRPDASINRAEFTKIIIETIGNDTDDSNCFPDVHAEWFARYVCSAKSLNIISGYPDGSFKPSNPISFAEASKIIANASRLEVDEREDEWFSPFVIALEKKKAIPMDITEFSQLLNRGQMAGIMHRLHAKNTDLPSQTYASLGGKRSVITQASSTSSRMHSSKATNVTQELPYTLPIGQNWKDAWDIVEIEGTQEGLKNVEVINDNEEVRDFLRINFPANSGNRFLWKFYSKPLGGFAAWINPHIEPTNDIYLRYQVRFPENFDFSHGGSLNGMLTGITNGREEESAGAAEVTWNEKGKIFIGGAFIDKLGKNGYLPTAGSFEADNKWHTIDLHLRLQTHTAKMNGAIEMWLDGEPILNNSDVLFQNRTEDKWDALIFGSYMGDASMSNISSEDMHVDMAGFTFSNKRLR